MKKQNDIFEATDLSRKKKRHAVHMHNNICAPSVRALDEDSDEHEFYFDMANKFPAITAEHFWKRRRIEIRDIREQFNAQFSAKQVSDQCTHEQLFLTYDVYIIDKQPPSLGLQTSNSFLSVPLSRDSIPVNLA